MSSPSDQIHTAEKSFPLTAQKHCEISIVILNWNQYDDTAECLRSLRHVHHPPFEIYLVDNGSIDGSPEKLVAEFPEVRIVRNTENLGYAEGNNVGIRKALESGANFILLLNNDTVVHAEFLAELMKVADREPTAGILGAKVVYYDRPDLLWALGGNLLQPFARIRMLGRDRPVADVGSSVGEFDHVPGATMFVRSEVFRRQGLLDRNYFLNWEDAEFCIRAKKAGWRVLGVPNSVVLHKVSRATAGKLAMYFGQRNRLLFASTCLPRWQFALCVVPFHLVRLAALAFTETVQSRQHLFKAALLGTVDYFRGRMGSGSMARLERL